jgi:hypothetical protein
MLHEKTDKKKPAEKAAGFFVMLHFWKERKFILQCRPAA